MVKPRIFNLLLLLFLLVGLCACDGEEKDTVKIVASLPILPEEGVGTGWDIAQGMQFALEEADHRAGEFTVEFELLDASAPEDDILVPQMEVDNAEQAAADPNALVYLGNFYSSACKIGVPILNRAGVPQISPGATYPGLTKPGFAAGEPAIYYPGGERTFFRVIATDDMQGPAGAFWASDTGSKRIYVVVQDDLYGQGLAQTFKRAATAGDLTVVETTVVAEGQATGLDEIAADVAAQQPDLVYYTGFLSGAVPLVRALRAGGVTATFMGADAIYTPALIEKLGADAEGVRATFPGVSIEDLGQVGQDFAQRFQDQFGRQPGGWCVPGYESMRIALAAIERAGQADRDAVLEALRETDFEGLAGRYTFDKNGDTNLLLVSGMHVEDGEWKSEGLLRVR